jgi:hypothetical protein
MAGGFSPQSEMSFCKESFLNERFTWIVKRFFQNDNYQPPMTEALQGRNTLDEQEFGHGLDFPKRFDYL